MYTELTEGDINAAKIHNKAIFLKQVAGVMDNPEEQLVKPRNISVEERKRRLKKVERKSKVGEALKAM